MAYTTTVLNEIQECPTLYSNQQEKLYASSSQLTAASQTEH